MFASEIEKNALVEVAFEDMNSLTEYMFVVVGILALSMCIPFMIVLMAASGAILNSAILIGSLMCMQLPVYYLLNQVTKK